MPSYLLKPPSFPPKRLSRAARAGLAYERRVGRELLAPWAAERGAWLGAPWIKTEAGLLHPDWVIAPCALGLPAQGLPLDWLVVVECKLTAVSRAFAQVRQYAAVLGELHPGTPVLPLVLYRAIDRYRFVPPESGVLQDCMSAFVAAPSVQAAPQGFMWGAGL